MGPMRALCRRPRASITVPFNTPRRRIAATRRAVSATGSVVICSQPVRAELVEHARNRLEGVEVEAALVERDDRVEHEAVEARRVQDAVSERELGPVGAPVERDLVEAERLPDRVDVGGRRAGRVERRRRPELPRARGGACRHCRAPAPNPGSEAPGSAVPRTARCRAGPRARGRDRRAAREEHVGVVAPRGGHAPAWAALEHEQGARGPGPEPECAPRAGAACPAPGRTGRAARRGFRTGPSRTPAWGERDRAGGAGAARPTSKRGRQRHVPSFIRRRRSSVSSTTKTAATNAI